jgi:hypothetical protein
VNPKRTLGALNMKEERRQVNYSNLRSFIL